MKSVLNPDTNEVLGFDDNMSDDAIAAAIQSDKEGRPMADVNPTPYDVHVRPALEQAKLTGNNQILYDARRKAMAEDPFNKALLHGLTFGLTPDNDPETKKAHGYADTLGNLAGQTGSILATAGVGEVIGLGKAAATVGNAAKAALPASVAAAEVGSGQILAKTAGEVVKGVASGVTSSAALGAMYNGITESVAQGKSYLTDHQAPDVAKLGESILKGAVSWAPYGVAGGFVPKTAPGLAAGTSVVAGTAYVVSKAEGQSEADARMNAVIMGMFHFVSHVGGVESQLSDLKPKDNIVRDANGEPITVGMTPEMRQGIVEDLQNTIGAYTKAKNGMTEANNLHQMVGDEYVKSEAQRVIEEQNAEFIAAAAEAKARAPEIEAANKAEAEAAKIAAEEKLAGTFKDPYSGKMMDYLSQFIPPEYIVRMDGTERLRLANSKRKELVGLKESYDLMAQQDAAELAKYEAKLENEAFLRRTQNNTLQEVATSDTLTKRLVGSIAQKFIDPVAAATPAEGSKTTPEASAKGAGPGEAAPASVSRETSDLSTASAQPVNKPAKAASDISQKLVEQGFKELTPEEQATFTPITKKDTVKSVTEHLDKDYEAAKRQATGAEPVAEGVHPQVLFNAVKNRAIAEGDINTLRDLAASPLAKARSEAAQTLSASGFNNETFDPVQAIQEVSKAREAVETKKSGEPDLKKSNEAVVKEIKKSIKKSAPKITEWNDFLESIRC